MSDFVQQIMNKIMRSSRLERALYSLSDEQLDHWDPGELPGLPITAITRCFGRRSEKKNTSEKHSKRFVSRKKFARKKSRRK